MMALKRDVGPIGELLASLVDADVLEPLAALSSALLELAGVVSRARRAQPAPVTDAELRTVDEIASRSIRLAREVRERLQARRVRGEYNSAAQVAREVVAQLERVLPANVQLAVDGGLAPALVAADRSSLRRVLFAIVEVAADAMPRGGRVVFEVTQHAGTNGQSVAQIEARCSVEVDAADARIDAARARVGTLGGTFHARRLLTGGSSVVVRLPGL